MKSLVDHYLAEYETYCSHLPSSHAENLKLWQRPALQHFAKAGLPSTHLEAWQYTARHSMMKRAFHLIKPSELPKTLDKTTLQHQFPQLTEKVSAQLVFINGKFIATLSSLDNIAAPGLSIQSLGELSRTQSEYFIKHWGNSESLAETDSLNALNQFLSQDGAVIEVAPNCIVEAPIELLFLSDTSADPFPNYTLIPIRNLIRVAKGSRASFIERYHSLDPARRLFSSAQNQGIALDEKRSVFDIREHRSPSLTTSLGATKQPSPIYCTHAVTELILEPESSSKWYHKTQENPISGHIGELKVTQHAHSHLSTYTLSLGSALVRRALSISLQGENATCTSRGLSLSNKKQFIDHYVKVSHHAPHTESDVHYRAIANDQSHIVFGGDVQVKPGVFKIKAKQNNHNLLLSSEAEIDSKPKLTILADDVACTHGATMGQLNDKLLFYLYARGISKEDARTMLITAFANVILNEMSIITNPTELQTLLTHETIL